MATRWYLPSTGAAPVSPALHSAWNFNTASPSRLAMVRTRINSAMANVAVTETTAAQANIFHRQYVSEPIGAQTITGTVRAVVRASESATGANMAGQLVAYVVSGDGATVRGVLYAGDAGTGTGNPTNEYTTTLGSRFLPGSAATVNVSSVAAQNGDRIVIELGTRMYAASATNYVSTLNFGDNSATDLTTTAGVTTANNPWVEFSADIDPASSGDPKNAPDSHTVGSSDTASVTETTAPFVQDSFTDTDGTLLTAHTGEIGATWTRISGTFNPTITAGRVYNGGPNSIALASGTPATNEYDVEAEVHTLSVAGGTRIIGRAIDATNFYAAYRSTIAIRLDLGISTQLASYLHTPTVGIVDDLKLEIRDGTKKVFLNGVEILSTTHNTITDAGQVGVVAFSGGTATGFHLDNFTATNATAGPADEPKSAPDSHALTHSDTATSSGTVTAAESGPLTHTDAASRAATSTTSDTHAIVSSDTASVSSQSILAAPDTHALGHTDTASVTTQEAKAAPDTHVLTATDAATRAATGTVAESRPLTHTDAASRATTGASADTHMLGYTDTASVSSQTSHTATDAHTLVATDSTTAARTGSVGEAAAISASDVAAASATLAAAESSALTGISSIANSASTSTGDTAALTGADAASITTQAAFTAPDAHVVGATDATAAARTGTAPDTHAIVAADTATGPRTGAATDTHLVAGSEAAAIATTNTVADAASAGAAESSAVTGMSTLADAHNATGADTGTSMAISDAVDTDTLGADEGISLVTGGAWFAEDTHIVTGTDGVSLMVYMASDDIAVVMGDDASALIGLVGAGDDHLLASLDTYQMSTELPTVIPEIGVGVVTRIPVGSITVQRVPVGLVVTRTALPAIQVSRAQVGDILTVERTQQPSRLEATRVQQESPLAVNRTLQDAPLAVSRIQYEED